MEVDVRTLRDLDLIGSSDGGANVCDLLDTTRTRRGAQALRRRLTRPLSDPAAIADVQDAVRFFAHPGRDPLLDARLVERVTRYLDSSFDVLSSRSRLGVALESRWAGLRYRDFVKHAREGTGSARALVERTAIGVRRLREASPPRPVAELLDGIEELCDRLEQGSGAGSPLADDRFFRAQGRDALSALLDVLGELDALASMGDATRRLGLHLPRVHDAPAFRLEGRKLWHPFLPDAVTNPVRVEGGETLVFLTGPNMAGKTTYLKAVGVAVHLAHCGMAVPAEALDVTCVDALYTSLRPEDDLRAGLSFFMAEVRRVREVAAHLATGGRAFVLFDEIFRGTNVHDALEASKTVIHGFARASGSGFIVSSHLVELADQLGPDAGVRFAHFEGDIVDGQARYGFELREGVSRQRLGLHLLEQEGVPALLDAIGT
ncbi:MAG: hypothetical protein R3E98_12925 [Gemmatimonadota bacterium]